MLQCQTGIFVECLLRQSPDALAIAPIVRHEHTIAVAYEWLSHRTPTGKVTGIAMEEEHGATRILGLEIERMGDHPFRRRQEDLVHRDIKTEFMIGRECCWEEDQPVLEKISRQKKDQEKYSEEQ